jgi:hypothetical protein
MVLLEHTLTANSSGAASGQFCAILARKQVRRQQRAHTPAISFSRLRVIQIKPAEHIIKIEDLG